MDIIICIFFALEAGDLINSFTLLTNCLISPVRERQP